MTRPVIVGADGSEPARQAVQTAARLALALDAPLVVVCAYEKFEVSTINEGGDAYRYASDEEAQTIAQNEAGAVAQAGLTATGVAEMGKPADALIRVAENADAGLIVVGNRRVQGMARLLGSIASSVAAKAPCDVYIAHTN